MVLLSSSFDQSKYLSAEDIKAPKKVRIKAVTVDKLGEDQKTKPVLWFTNMEKGLSLNKINRRVLREAFGNDDMEQWVGKVIEIYPIMTEYKGRPCKGLRVRLPEPKVQ